jgi:hypothetical protein
MLDLWREWTSFERALSVSLEAAGHCPQGKSAESASSFLVARRRSNRQQDIIPFTLHVPSSYTSHYNPLFLP